MKIKTVNPKYAIKDRYFFEIPEFIYYEGSEITVKWVDADLNLCLATGNPEFPMSIVPRRLIVEQDGATHKPTTNSTRTVVVRGSKGSDYVVSLGKTKSCTCSGFQFRRHCKHLSEAEKVVL